MTEYFIERVNRWGVEEHYIQEKLPSGMTMEFGYSWEVRPHADDYELVLFPFMTVYHKRKKSWPDDPAQTTGRDGLLPAMIALKTLEHLVSEHSKQFPSIRVCVEWVDNRRRDVYHKVLSRRGYYFTHWQGRKVLEKVYKQEEK